MTEAELAYVQGIRDGLIDDLNRGRFNQDIWRLAIEVAHKYNCEAIASQLEQYFKHYEMETN